ncbi:MAG: alpha-glucan family phosphorylase [Acidobacteria bacterium]|nr:alpha-glucan family phosphorylase [Acidobacteriota bacterium]NIM62554.1 alpha-glucan family phosphorylase [Acidobacteriota bacterium]NIO58287.1 alpha-glucan family phosphorylase [Acidobacteriota bacterium]NIQ29343.1 alpha-glucan family phosphorylase [Acidobacteriota bacterium]NIQ83943.1 alpha-glucan family phosphorylase [Acidobacteriota bacterium]
MALPEIKTRAPERIQIPLQFSRLRDIAYNLWWTWTPQARKLFNGMDRGCWARYRNPIELLIDMDPQRWHELADSEEFIRGYRDLVERFDGYMASDQPTWFEQRGTATDGPIAYFSTEFGWHESLHVYSGGLGILSGDHCKSASDLGLPFVGVGLMYRHGYFRQIVDPDGQQEHFYPDYDPWRVPLLAVVDEAGRDLRIDLPLSDRIVRLGAWKAQIGRVPVLLLDTDLPENHPADRAITSVLYVSGREMRFCQEWVLGIGGAKLLRVLGTEPSVWHMNEGHSSLLSLDRLAMALRGTLDFDAALAAIRANAVFTTHTPVPAGNEVFEAQMVRRYIEPWGTQYGVPVDRALDLGAVEENRFNLTALALRTSSRANGVSERHGRIAGSIWNGLLEGSGHGPVEHITNGVHAATWIGPEMHELLCSRFGEFDDDQSIKPFAEAMEQTTDADLWEAHRIQKNRLVRVARERLRDQFARHGRSPDELRRLDHVLDPDILLVGFARRFATYKRADLILRDLDELKRIVTASERPVQFLFAGKAHPADRPGQELIRRIWQSTLDPELLGRVLFLENYDMRIGRYLVQGVDVWLNNPRRPLEASGTSGMKAAMNGVLNVSVLDGWWLEGYDAAHGWAIGPEERPGDDAEEDHVDAAAIYRVLTDEVVPCYYDRDPDGLPREWIKRMKRAIGDLAPRFGTARMVREYAERYYLGTVTETRS